jgi:hypothetical protein
MAAPHDVKQPTPAGEAQDQDPNYDLFIIALTIISLFTIVVIILPVGVNPAAKTITLQLDVVISVIFLSISFAVFVKRRINRLT